MSGLQIGDIVTYPTGGGHVRYGRVLQLTGRAIQADAKACFVVQTRTGQIARPTVRTFRHCDEGVRWLRGQYAEDNKLARALCAAQALVGVSPWKETPWWGDTL